VESSVRASLIRVNACRFADRYTLAAGGALDEGSFGRVQRCSDNLVRIGRAVKSIRIPSDPRQLVMLHREVEALVALDHPHIVRLIEYFEEGSELLLVMELLEGLSLGHRMRLEGRFGERLAAMCARHMLKALFCCHSHGIAHNDVSTENFKFLGQGPESALKMVDFGLSERFDAPAACHAMGAGGEQGEGRRASEDQGDYLEKRDIWRAGVILFAMLEGSELFPEAAPPGTGGSPSWAAQELERLVCATDPGFVPRRLGALQVSEEARGILEGMLQLSTSRRLAAREALVHRFIKRSYGDEQNARLQSRSAQKALGRFVLALRGLSSAVRLKRLAMLITAHLLANNDPTIAEINWLFRFLVRDGDVVEEAAIRQVMSECDVEVPCDFGVMFASADPAGSGGLHYVEFVAASIIIEPRAFCSDMMLRKVFHFLDGEDSGLVTERSVRSVFALPAFCDGGVVREACGEDTITFPAFRTLMVPDGWEQQEGTPAPWADAPDSLFRTGSDVGRLEAAAGPPEQHAPYNPVRSAQSEVFNIRQEPGFHAAALRPLYEAQPVSNVVAGIVRGTSGYARQVVELGLAEVVELGTSDRNGAFFFMPNPKYHWEPSDIVVREDQRLRFVAWWIHPDFLDELRKWVGECNVQRSPASCDSFADSRPQASRGAAAALGQGANVGSPGDFGYSDVQKPEGYLHTYRDLCRPAHLDMLEALVVGVGLFLERLLGAALPDARLSAGFHYPVRPQYSTLHLQLRINSGDVCGGPEQRGADLFKLRAQLRRDPEALRGDGETLRYQATANLRTTLLAAAASQGRCVREVGPQSLVLM